MEQLIAEIEEFAARANMKPQLVLKRAAGYGWNVWGKWKSGDSAPTVPVADKIRSYIQNNNPSSSPALTAASSEGSLPTKKRRNAKASIQGEAPQPVPPKAQGQGV